VSGVSRSDEEGYVYDARLIGDIFFKNNAACVHLTDAIK
jgi:hypothetical protein